MKKKRINWANALTWSRFILIFPITAFAYMGMRWTVFWLFIVAMLTDFFDGKVAHWAGTAGPKGAAFDSQVDTAMMPFMFVWIWLLAPAFFIDFWPWIVVILGLQIVQLIIAYVKLGKVVSLHLWSDKVAAVCGAAFLPSLIVFGYVPWVVWPVIIVSILAFTEEIIYLLKGGKNLDARGFWDE